MMESELIDANTKTGVSDVENPPSTVLVSTVSQFLSRDYRGIRNLKLKTCYYESLSSKVFICHRPPI